MRGFEAADAPAYSAGQQTAVAIPKKHNLAGLVLAISGTNTATGGASAGTYHPDGIYRNVRNVLVQAKGSTLVSAPGQTLRIIDRMGLGGFQKTQTQPTNVAPASTGAFALNLPIPFTMPHTFQPEAFGLPTAAPNVAPQLYVTWGSPNDMITGEGATVFSFGTPTVALYQVVHDLNVMAPAALGIPGTALAPVYILSTEVPLTQTETGKRIYLDNVPAGRDLRAVIIETFYNGTSGADFSYSDSVISRMTLNIDGQDRVTRMPFALNQMLYPGDYGWGGTETGVAILDAASSRRTERGALWSIQSSGRPYIEVDATKQAGDNMIRVTTLSTPTNRNF